MNKIIKRRDNNRTNSNLSDDWPPLLKQIYAAREVVDQAQINTDLSSILTPEKMKGLSQAVELITSAVKNQQRILIVGDFDADGATSCALAVLALRTMGADHVEFLVPNRFDYGYGLTPEIVAVALHSQPDLIITVDNGISSVDGVDAAKKAGIKVIVTDHHLPGLLLPRADAIVNPNQHGCEFESKHLAGVGVIFYVMSALRTHLKNQGWFEQQQIAEPKMAEFLDLVALGTVADVVPLDKNNRILVAQGLRRIRAGRCRVGITALLMIANRSAHRIVSSDLGFAIGPRLNAAGRLDDISLGIQCLTTDNESLAIEMARQMDDLNQDRKAIESGMQSEALLALKKLDLSQDNKLNQGGLPFGICLYDANWHQGVIGILASRIKDLHHRPVIVFAAVSEDMNSAANEIIKGSARSIPGLHIRDLLDTIAALHPHLLSKFGGHAMAAGMTLLKKDYAEFVRVFDQQVREQLGIDDLQCVLLSDGELTQSDFTLSLARRLREAGPWGQNFPEPQFDGVFYLIQKKIVGEKHLKLILSLDAEAKQLVDAIAFNVDVGLWSSYKGSRVKVVYKLDVNEFRGKESVQLMVNHIEQINN